MVRRSIRRLGGLKTLHPMGGRSSCPSRAASHQRQLTSRRLDSIRPLGALGLEAGARRCSREPKRLNEHGARWTGEVRAVASRSTADCDPWGLVRSGSVDARKQTLIAAAPMWLKVAAVVLGGAKRREATNERVSGICERASEFSGEVPGQCCGRRASTCNRWWKACGRLRTDARVIRRPAPQVGSDRAMNSRFALGATRSRGGLVQGMAEQMKGSGARFQRSRLSRG